MRYNISLALLTALSLLACGEKNVTQQAPTEKIEPSAVTASPAESLRKKPTKNAGKPAIKAIETTVKPLDLTLPETEQNAFDHDASFTQKDSMQDLFVKHKKESLMSIDGKLLQNKENPDYIDSIEGAEFSIKIKTK